MIDTNQEMKQYKIGEEGIFLDRCKFCGDEVKEPEYFDGFAYCEEHWTPKYVLINQIVRQAPILSLYTYKIYQKIKSFSKQNSKGEE